MIRKLSFRSRGEDTGERWPSIKFTVTARLRGPLTAEQLHAALARLAVRHPLLSSRVASDETGQLYLTNEEVPPIALRIVERERDDDWAREIEREVIHPSNYSSGPLFGLIWLRGSDSSDLILVCDHMTSDGRAGIYALRDLLALLADPQLRPPALEPPPLTELIPPAMLERIEEICRPNPEEPEPQGKWMDFTPADSPLRVLPFALDEQRTAALITRCRAEKASVQAALCAAFLTAYAELEPESPVRRVEIPVDIRSRLAKPVDDAYISLISFAIVDVDCAPTYDPWEVARAARAALADQLNDEQLFTFPFMLMQVSGRMPSGRMFAMNYDLSISNLGRVDIPAQYGSLQLESIYAPTMNVTLPQHRILGVTTFGGRMCCTFTSRDPGAPALLERASEILLGMI